ncbi:MAG: phasin family protein [Caldilineaceae bacterium]|nr:phasin family protein [Caldilineaceae bacterium]
MEVKLDVRNVDLRNTQEMVEDNVKQMQKTGRKVARTYAGLLAMAYDGAMTIVKQGRQMVIKAENRGEKMEAATVRQVKNARKGVEKQVKKAEKEVQEVQKRLTKQVRRSETQAENEIDAQVERVLERLGIPSRDRIVKLSTEIEALSRKIDQGLVQADIPMAAPTTAPMAAPLADYESMTAREIVALLGGMSAGKMAEVRAYEMAHDNRVTITREIDRLLETGEQTGEIVVA